MKRLTGIIVITSVVLLAGCSGEGGNDGDHVWKEQTDTIDRAEQAEDLMKKSAEEQRKKIDSLE